ncbi:topology modulation protein [Heyndrickxia camelliae]|uniref:Topology modulation protein n=1 Tax=Heyndrickxia camelliae TaxID=1707093 RepID=A0A2N3LKX7_9BACI|nr:topology modulation protein [Heyndrickxia camelliae]PKR85266.1 topology modulation protein [Heyndrickxia camelliae]
MERIMVIGVSAGVGKSTFARKLGEILNKKVYHLDSYYWKPGWVESPLEEFRNAQREMVQHNEWIIEGNYSNSFDIRTEACDTIIYLELPLVVCLYRVLKRWLANLGRTRPDLGEGCPEKMEWKFLKFIYTTYYPRKKKMAERFQQLGSEKTIIVLKSKKAIRKYLENISLTSS